MKSQSTLTSRFLSILTVAALLFALNTSGALAGFWRTLDGITANGVPNPAQFLYGLGTNGTTNGITGFGYGYGYGQFGYGYASATATTTSTTTTTTTTTSSSSSGGGGGGGGSSNYTNTTNNVKIVESTTQVDNTNTKSGVSTSAEPKISTENAINLNTFSDTRNHWAKSYISAMKKLGLANGNENGEFEPDRAITRAETLKLALRGFGINYGENDKPAVAYDDVDNTHWTSNVIGKAQKQGIISGYSKETFGPNNAITRAEAMKIIMLASGVEIQKVENSEFDDVSGWSLKYIETARRLGIISNNKSFRPEDPITRAELSKILIRLLAK